MQIKQMATVRQPLPSGLRAARVGGTINGGTVLCPLVGGGVLGGGVTGGGTTIGGGVIGSGAFATGSAAGISGVFTRSDDGGTLSICRQRLVQNRRVGKAIWPGALAKNSMLGLVVPARFAMLAPICVRFCEFYSWCSPPASWLEARK